MFINLNFIHDIPEPYLTLVKMVLISFIFGFAGKLARYIYYDL